MSETPRPLGRGVFIFGILFGCSDPPDPPVGPPPPDLPRWSSARWVDWDEVDAPGERAIVVDVTGGWLDKVIDDPDVTTVLNERFEAIFLHPRARPDLTARFGWPALVLVDGEGCVRASGAPSTAAEAIELVNEALRARHEGRRSALPAPRLDVLRAEGGGEWTADDPALASRWADPDRGTPAVVWDGRPWLWPDQGPKLDCPLSP